MNITIVGSGYVGLVAGACFAEMGNKVTCVDIDERKVKHLKEGIIPIYEPGLSEMIANCQQRGNILFTTSLSQGIKDSEIIFIAVGTPMGEDGSADLKYVKGVAKEIGQVMTNPIIVVDKSTVPVGTADIVRKTIQNSLNDRGVKIPFDVVSNPEFLKEGAAINDFMRPDRVVVGADKEDSLKKMKELYAPFIFNHDRFIGMDIRSAEMTKYAANAMLATKISFINEIANICEYVGANVNKVRIGIGSDSRIGYKFIYPGCGYGGSCFPKDVKALEKIAIDAGYNPRLISAVEEVNKIQKLQLAKKVVSRFGENLQGKIFAVWGLAFKPETDDMREAPAIDLIKELTERGAKVNAYDPKAYKQAQLYLKDLEVNYCDDKYSALEGADALVLVTEWKEFRSPDFNRIKSALHTPVLIDGRNQYDDVKMQQNGFEYYQIGVSAS
tara:strand:- start:5333 stop:6658 length:1326 start_codon:yes stop_codon:yes gene_type:complete